MARCCTSGLLQGAFTPLEPCIFLVRHPAVSKGPLTCEDVTGCEHVSVNPGSDLLAPGLRAYRRHDLSGPDLLHAMPSALVHAARRRRARHRVSLLSDDVGQGAVLRREVVCGIAADNLLTAPPARPVGDPIAGRTRPRPQGLISGRQDEDLVGEDP